MLRDDLPSDPIIDTVLEQHCLVHSVGIAQVGVATVRLRKASNLQNKHYFAGEKKKQGDACERVQQSKSNILTKIIGHCKQTNKQKLFGNPKAAF